MEMRKPRRSGRRLEDDGTGRADSTGIGEMTMAALRRNDIVLVGTPSLLPVPDHGTRSTRLNGLVGIAPRAGERKAAARWR
jgi:hypothetical protein